MFYLLIRVRLLSLWNTARYYASRHRLLTLGLALAGVLLFGGVYLGFRVFLSLVPGKDETHEMVFEVFYFLFLFLLAGAVPFVASTLLHSADYMLLSAAPLRPGTVVAAKLLDATVTNSLQFTVIGVPAIVACAAALGMPPAGWAIVPALIALFVLLPALITSLLLLFALATLGMRRVRGAITAVNALMASIVCLTIVVQAGQLQFRSGFHQELGTVSSGSPSSHLGPSGPFAWTLIQASSGQMPAALREMAWLALLVALLYVACMQWGGRLLSAASVAEENDGATALPSGETWSSRRGLLRLLASPVAALVAKDIRYVLRDSVLLSQLGMPVILFFVPIVLAMQQGAGRMFASPSELYPFAAAMTGIIVFMQTSIISLSSVGLESRSFWLVLSSPNAGRTLLWAKFAMSTFVSAGVGVFLTAVSAFVFEASPGTALIQCVIVALLAAGLCGLGVGISAALPRFVYDNPAHRVSAWALILGFFATVGYLIFEGVLGASVWRLATLLSEQAAGIYAVGGALFVVTTLAAIAVPMAIGARRIEVYQWEH